MSAAIIPVAKSSSSCLIESTTETTTSKLWFKTEPISRSFCYRVVQLQLRTDSSDQGYDRSITPGSWSWFELAIFEHSDALEPRVKDGKHQVWRSHGNRTDPLDVKDSVSRHFGIVFDRRHDLLDNLEAGNVIGVRVCARYPGWANNAQDGRLTAKVLDDDLFSPGYWTLSDSQETPEDIPDAIQNGVYTLTPTTACQLKSETDEQTDTIWFSTPILDEAVIPRIEDIQLFTIAHNQGERRQGIAGDWSWFDLIILETPESTVPKVVDGRALVWRSHNVPIDAGDDSEQPGELFGQDKILGHLKPGNVIAVRACTRFPGWELHGHSARLLVRISNNGPHHAPTKSSVDWKAVIRANKQLQDTLEIYLKEVSPDGKKPAALSVEATLMAQELRTDWQYGAGERPLRLLSLDGGGVRGIGSLHVLKTIMAKVAGDPNAKPCDYFDMMAGTSTGGLIAIMLGRLGMTVDQCIDAYKGLAKKIFSASALNQLDKASDTGARYSAVVLEQEIKGIVKKYTGNEDEPMRDPKGGCKVFVLSCRADDLSNIATHLRTYTNTNVEKSFADYKIWEAGRATSAAPTYFPRIKLGDHEYIDGGVGFNNPVLLLMGEARIFYGFARPIGCLVTIGTGMDPNVALPPESTNTWGNMGATALVLERMWELITKAEHANQMAKPLAEPGSYFRFNLGKKLVEKRWVETVNPNAFNRWFGSDKATKVEHYTPENWAKVTIELDDYNHMDDFVELTLKYMETEVERAQTASSKLPPKRRT